MKKKLNAWRVVIYPLPNHGKFTTLFQATQAIITICRPQSKLPGTPSGPGLLQVRFSLLQYNSSSDTENYFVWSTYVYFGGVTFPVSTCITYDMVSGLTWWAVGYIPCCLTHLT